MKDVKNEGPTKNSYKPSDTLTDYLNEKLQISNLEREKIMRREELSDEVKKRKKLNERNRVYVLNRHVFEPLADLITFFEFTTLDHPELQEDYEDEMEELLMGWNKNDKRFQDTNRATAFARFVWSATHWDYDEDRSNFRLSLLFQMQKRITLKISDFAKEDFDKGAGEFGISENIVKPDMKRAFAWTGHYARNTSKSKNQKRRKNIHRPALF